MVWIFNVQGHTKNTDIFQDIAGNTGRFSIVLWDFILQNIYILEHYMYPVLYKHYIGLHERNYILFSILIGSCFKLYYTFSSVINFSVSKITFKVGKKDIIYVRRD